jgi:outer membrane lipoprotein SlyB
MTVENREVFVMKTLQILSFCVITALLAGCVSSQSGEVYSRSQAQQAQSVQMGTVEFVKQVKVEGTKSGIGAVVGGIAGGVAGSTIGGGDGQKLATLGGALGGAAAGALAEEKLTDYDGLEITVKLDSGSAIVVVQKADVLFFVGERVRVITATDGAVRVTK